MEKDEILKIFKNPPILECDRVILRKMDRSFADDMFEYASNPAVTKYLTWDVHPNRRFSYNYLGYVNSRYRKNDRHLRLYQIQLQFLFRRDRIRAQS